MPNLPTLPWTAPWPRMALASLARPIQATWPCGRLLGFPIFNLRGLTTSVCVAILPTWCAENRELCRVGYRRLEWKRELGFQGFAVMRKIRYHWCSWLPVAGTMQVPRLVWATQGACARAKIKEMGLVVAWHPMYPARNGWLARYFRVSLRLPGVSTQADPPTPRSSLPFFHAHFPFPRLLASSLPFRLLHTKKPSFITCRVSRSIHSFLHIHGVNSLTILSYNPSDAPLLEIPDRTCAR